MLADSKESEFTKIDSMPLNGWQAQLELGFERSNDITVLAHRR
ncbi:MAG: hypothetical protein RIR39_1060, partial [Pseudomonadota bacterium]